jgi:polyhydroxyalkanoate synthesis regulator phasin
MGSKEICLEHKVKTMSYTQPFWSKSEGHTAATATPIGSPRNFVLACIGLLSLLADEIPELLERSVQRGNAVVEQAQAEARRRAAPPEAAPQATDEWQNELSRLGLPTHRDLEALLQRVTELEQQIDRIAAQRSVAP